MRTAFDSIVTGPRKARLTSGFTLIELLIVIAIIAILAAILFPVFATAREKARQTACVSNEKQLGLAFLQYVQDYDEFAIQGRDLYGTGNCWAGILYPYVKSINVFLCPSDTISGDVSSYAYNSNFVFPSPTAWTSGTGQATALSTTKLLAPGKTIVFAEVSGSGGYDITQEALQTSIFNGWSPTGTGLGTASNSQPVGGSTSGAALQWATGYTIDVGEAPKPACFTGQVGRHNNGANYLFADGHAKWLMPTLVYAGTTNSTPGNCGGYTVAAATDCTAVPVGGTFSPY